MKSPSQASLRAFRAFTAHVAPPMRARRDIRSEQFASLLKIVENDALKKSEQFRSELVDAIATIEASNGHSTGDIFSEVWTSGMDSSAAVGEIIHAMAQTGHLSLARGLALSAFERIEASDPFLRYMTRAFETCLDFDAAYRAVDSWISLVDAGSPVQRILERKLALYDGLRAEAFDLDVRWSDFRAMQEYFVDAIRQEGRRVQSIVLHGTLPCSVTLDFHIDAELDECIPMDFELGGKVMHAHRDCHAMDVVPFCIVSFAAHRDSNPNTIEAIRRGGPAMITPDEVLGTAVASEAHGTEADYRNCVSRAYYSMFHKAREAADRHFANRIDCHRKSTHLRLSSQFESANCSSASAVARRLKAMKKARCRADYDLGATVTRRHAEVALKTAHEFASRIEACIFQRYSSDEHLAPIAVRKRGSTRRGAR